MKWHRNDVVGRSAQLRELCEYAGTPRVLAVRGARGSGRTALLGRARDLLTRHGRIVLDLSGEHRDDLLCGRLLDEIRNRFEELGGGARLAAAVEKVHALHAAGSAASPATRLRLLQATLSLLTVAGERTRLVILVDDADHLADPAFALAPFVHTGHTVIASCAAGPVAELADRIVDLDALPDEKVDALAVRRWSAPLDGAFHRTLAEALGPLRGNPRAVVSALGSMVETGELAAVHGVLVPASAHPRVSLAADHPLAADLHELGEPASILLAAAPAAGRTGGDGELTVDSIPLLARQHGCPEPVLGEALDRLARNGVLAVEDSGRIRCVIPALSPHPTATPTGDDHTRVADGYASGDWTAALSAARRTELSGPADDPRGPVTRLLAAEMCGWRGEDVQAAAWFAAAGGDTDPRVPALRAWVGMGLRRHSNHDGHSNNDGDSHHDGDGSHDAGDAFAYGWQRYLRHRDRLDEPGASRLLVRLATAAVDRENTRHAASVLDETARRYGRGPTLQLVRGVIEANREILEAAERAIRRRGDRFEHALVCRRLAVVSSDPHPWLSRVSELATSADAVRLVPEHARAGRARPGSRRSRSGGLSAVERRIVTLIRDGRTNRQIAADLSVSAKTVEKYLTRLFEKAGCRTRHALAMSGLATSSDHPRPGQASTERIGA